MLFIDGTKIEANANRYTFVWRGTINYHLAGLLDTIDSLYQKYNTLIDENKYGMNYGIPHAHMFVIEGMDKVREVIEKNRKRKLTKHKKLPIIRSSRLTAVLHWISKSFRKIWHRLRIRNRLSLFTKRKEKIRNPAAL